MNLKKILERKKETNEKIEEQIITDYFAVISPDEIAELNKPPFSGKYAKEEEYKTGLEKVQPLFDEYEEKGTIPRLEYNDFKDISLNFEEKRLLDNFKSSFLDSGKCINVKKNIDGKYTVCTNGRHRMYVAKKYGLRLLVHVVREEVK